MWSRFGPWELDDAILERDYRKAVSVVGAMLDDGVEPLLVLSKIVRVWRQLFIGKGLAGKRSANEVAAAAGVAVLLRVRRWRQAAGSMDGPS